MKSVNTKTLRAQFSRARGFSAMLSMIFVVLFSTLAVGFYAATTTSTQISSNDQRAGLAQLASESGMDVMRYQLAQIKIPPGTPSSVIMDTLYTQLSANMNGTRNMSGETVGYVSNCIYIPANTSHFLPLDTSGQSKYAITITTWGSDIVVKSTGSYGAFSSSSAPTNSASRAITMDFTTKSVPTDSFDFAVASKGQVVISKGTISAATGASPGIAAIMSDSTGAGAINISGGTVGGDLNILSGASVNVTGGNVGGTSNTALIRTQHTHVVGEPDFPVVDTSVYLPYATNTYVAGVAVQQNIVIPPNTNPQFGGGDNVQGIMYIKSPNTVTFRGNFKLQGFIVFENAGSPAVNTLDFRGNVSQTALPAAATFDQLRAVSGVAMLAPTAAVSMSGSADSNVKGSLIVGTFSWSGAANLYVDNGTIMALSPGANAAVFNGSKSVLFTATGEKNQPSAGLSYPSYFAPKPSTYQEILP
jgi:hypothetical protein